MKFQHVIIAKNYSLKFHIDKALANEIRDKALTNDTACKRETFTNHSNDNRQPS